MSVATPLLLVPFREVRHFQHDDCLHCEPIEVRGRIHHWKIPAHRHQELIQFEMIERGAVVASIDGAVHRLPAPAAWMISPGVMHGFDYEPESSGFVVSVPTAFLQSSFATSRLLADRLARPVIASKTDIGSDAEELSALFRRTHAEFLGSRPGRAIALQSQAMLLGLWFIRRSETIASDVGDSGLHDPLMTQFKALLETNFCKHWPVSKYAELLDVSGDHLSRRCRAATGVGALDVIHDRLLLEARRQLAYTSADVVAIARQLGFDDPGYFSRMFSKHVGRSPSAYRAAIAAGLALLPDSAVGG